MSDARIPFDDAVSKFREWIKREGWPDDILWLTLDRVTGRKTKFWLLRPEEMTGVDTQPQHPARLHAGRVAAPHSERQCHHAIIVIARGRGVRDLPRRADLILISLHLRRQNIPRGRPHHTALLDCDHETLHKLALGLRGDLEPLDVWQHPAQIIENGITDTCGVHHKPGLPPLHKRRDTLSLNRLSDLLHYMSSSGDKTKDTTRYWFDTRANLRREMEERKKRFENKNEVRGRMADVVKKLAAGAGFFDGTHIFTPHSDVPDDTALRLVVLAPEQFLAREEPRLAYEAVLEYVKSNGAKPRYRGNRLIFLAPDHGALARLSDSIRVALAWNSIVEDVAAMRLVLDTLQAEQAKKELRNAEEVLPRVARECYKWLLCPSQEAPTGKPGVEPFPLNTSGASLGAGSSACAKTTCW